MWEWWGAGVVICLERGADLHMAQLMPLPLSVSCFSKIQTGFTFLVTAHLGSPGKGAVKRVCVCVTVMQLGIETNFCGDGWKWNESLWGWMGTCCCDAVLPVLPEVVFEIVTTLHKSLLNRTTCPSRPTLTSFPSFHGLWRCEDCGNGRSRLQDTHIYQFHSPTSQIVSAQPIQ